MTISSSSSISKRCCESRGYEVQPFTSGTRSAADAARRCAARRGAARRVDARHGRTRDAQGDPRRPSSRAGRHALRRQRARRPWSMRCARARSTTSSSLTIPRDWAKRPSKRRFATRSKKPSSAARSRGCARRSARTPRARRSGARARRCATSWRWSSASPTATSACCCAARAASARR